MRCCDCPYFWQEDEEIDSVMCHWESRCPGDMPPCEEEENERYNEEVW